MRASASRLSSPTAGVAATERAFSETPPARLYLDTNVVLDALIQTRPRHARVAALIRHLYESGLTTLYVSSLTWVEYGHIVVSEGLRALLPAETRDRFHLDAWDSSAVRAAYMADMVSKFEALLNQFPWVELPIGPGIRRHALELMPQYALKGNDAAHLASALQAEVYDLASFDKAFRKVDGLYLWNDLIHAEPAAHA